MKPTRAARPIPAATPRIPREFDLRACTMAADDARARSEIEFETRVESTLARKFVVERQRVQFVILVRDVQDPKARLGMTAPEAVAGEEVKLPQIVAFQLGRVTIAVLPCPLRLRLGEESARKIVESRKRNLMQDG